MRQQLYSLQAYLLETQLGKGVRTTLPRHAAPVTRKIFQDSPKYGMQPYLRLQRKSLL
jgi:hypothetical protein